MRAVNQHNLLCVCVCVGGWVCVGWGGGVVHGLIFFKKYDKAGCLFSGKEGPNRVSPLDWVFSISGHHRTVTC
jgi:hypothetical protein